ATRRHPTKTANIALAEAGVLCQPSSDENMTAPIHWFEPRSRRGPPVTSANNPPATISPITNEAISPDSSNIRHVFYPVPSAHSDGPLQCRFALIVRFP